MEAARPIIGRLFMEATEQVRLKQTIEQRWLKNLALYYGKYDALIEAGLTAEKRSTAFVKLTRHKTNSWAARIADLMFPTDDKNWGIKPTPLPKLSASAKEAVKAAMAAIDQANEAAAAGDQATAQQTLDMANAYAQQARSTQAEADEAKKRCKAMEDAIADQLVECDYVAQARDVIEDGCRLGTGIMKGPLTSQRLRAEWRKDEAIGDWTYSTIPDPMPEYRRVDPWHFFPDMSARVIGEAEFTYERSLPTKKDLRRAALRLGFHKPAVRRLLADGPGTLTSLDINHITQLRTLTEEGEAIKDRYVVWEFHGSLECDEIAALLRAVGNDKVARDFEENRDPIEDYRVIIYFCGSEILKIAPEYPLDSGETLYSVWNFEKGETSIFGIGVPEIMGDSQAAINGAWRMMMDNSALSVGPQIVVNNNAVTPQDGSFGLRPLKVWLRNSTALSNPNEKPFEVFNIPNNQAQLAGIIELGRSFVDEETSMPMIAQGEQGAASKTLGGMSMLFNSANVVFRRVVKSFDDELTKPTIRRAYDWNMQFNPDESVKGDMQVDARGSAVLLVREIQSQNLLNIMTNWTTHPVVGPWIKVRDGLLKALQTMMIPADDVLLTEEEKERNDQIAAARAAQAPAEDDGGMAELELKREIATIDADSRRYVADKGHEEAMMKLASEEKMTIEDLRSRLGIKQMEIGSKERIRAAEIGVEKERAAREIAAGDANWPDTRATIFTEIERLRDQLETDAREVADLTRGRIAGLRWFLAKVEPHTAKIQPGTSVAGVGY
jgi:hypothetical protein